ncbi:recombinase family protein [Budvicia aquatica]|uniref:recombinase family protein n=1 Tax=Budvicia aquatica TaxID=82979 RepID=UPI00208D6912|nr:recombinase family protein [Budvicia aquatica]GKX53621.1 DNA-invertase [Budvicia aquatica]
MLIGYVRVSTNDQQTDLQREALNRANCELIFEDKISGSKSERPGLKRLLKVAKEGDTVVVWKLDRLGRSVRHLITLVSDLKNRGIHFKSITDSIDTGSAAGRFFFHVMSALAEMERELIIERTLAGLAVARSQGRIGGRPRRLSEAQIEQSGRLLEKGHTRRELALIYDVSLATIYKYLPASRYEHSISSNNA